PTSREAEFGEAGQRRTSDSRARLRSRLILGPGSRWKFARRYRPSADESLAHQTTPAPNRLSSLFTRPSAAAEINADPLDCYSVLFVIPAEVEESFMFNFPRIPVLSEMSRLRST